MTIAACYLSPEGVVLGADSAATFGDHNHFFHDQKIFEIGKRGESRLALNLWGLGSTGDLSLRTLIGTFSDHVSQNPYSSVEELARFWGQLFGSVYKSEFSDIIRRVEELSRNPLRTASEDEDLEDLIGIHSGGFCIGGYALPDRRPKAFSFTYDPDELGFDRVDEISIGVPEFWGQPNMLRRLSFGIDMRTFRGILEAKKPDGTPLWTGTDDDLIEIVSRNQLGRPSKHLPIREAIDWVYSSIYTTIKAMKFANMPPVCGGPIEVAVITSDRCFRWVRHKDLDTAIGRHPFAE